MKKRSLISCLFVLLCLSSFAQTPNPIWVQAGYNGSQGVSNGTEVRPYVTISAAYALATPGTVVLVKPGTYDNEPSSDFNYIFLNKSGSESGGYITVRGISDSNGKKPLIVSNSVTAFPLAANASYIIIDNFEIKPSVTVPAGFTNANGSFRNSRRGFQLINGNHHIKILNNYIHDFGGNGIASGDGDLFWIEGNTVEHCGFLSNGGNSGISLYTPVQNSAFPNNWPEFPNHRIVIKGNICRYNVNLRGFGNGGRQFTDGNGIILDDFNRTQKRKQSACTPGTYVDGTTTDPWKGPYLARTLIKDNICYGNGAYGIMVFSSSNTDVINNTLFDNAHTTRITLPSNSVPIEGTENFFSYTNLIQDFQLSLSNVSGVTVRNNILVNSGNGKTLNGYVDPKQKIYTSSNNNIDSLIIVPTVRDKNLHWNANNGSGITYANGTDIIANPQFATTPIPLTPAQTLALATVELPFSSTSGSAALREPTVNNGFPIHNFILSGSSSALNTGVFIPNITQQSLFLGSRTDLGAVETLRIPSAGDLTTNDTQERELGIRFKTTISGKVTRIRFFKTGVNDNVTHIGKIWSLTGSATAPLATATFVNETASGWQEAILADGGLTLSANTTYIVSVNSLGSFPQKNYEFRATGQGAITNYGMTDGSSGLRLQTVTDAVTLSGSNNGSNNGLIYVYSSGSNNPPSTPTRPGGTYLSSNHFRDVVFVSDACVGCSARKATEETEIESKTGLTMQVYPNPANGGELQVTFSMGEKATAGQVQLVLLDLQGRVVRKLFSGSGVRNHTLTGSVRELPGSQYVLKLTADDQQISQKILINP